MVNVNKIKGIRAELGMTQSQFAKAVGIKNLPHKEAELVTFKITDLTAIVTYANKYNINVKVDDLIVY